MPIQSSPPFRLVAPEELEKVLAEKAKSGKAVGNRSNKAPHKIDTKPNSHWPTGHHHPYRGFCAGRWNHDATIASQADRYQCQGSNCRNRSRGSAIPHRWSYHNRRTSIVGPESKPRVASRGGPADSFPSAVCHNRRADSSVSFSDPKRQTGDSKINAT